MRKNTLTAEIQEQNAEIIRHLCNSQTRAILCEDDSPQIGFARIPLYIWRSDYDQKETGLSPQAAGLYCHLMGAKDTFANTETYVHTKTGWSRSAVSAAIVNLEECGLVTRERRRINGSYDACLIRVASHPLRVFQQMRARCLAGLSVNPAFFDYMQTVVLPNMGIQVDAALPALPPSVFVESWDEALGRYVRLPCFLSETGIAPRLVSFIACLMQTHVERGGIRLGAASHAAGINRKTSTTYARLLRARGIMVGCPNLYRSQASEDDLSSDGQARLFLSPTEISNNIYERATLGQSADVDFWDRLRRLFGDMPGFRSPGIGIITSSPLPFQTRVEIENPLPFQTQDVTFSSTNDNVYDNDNSENPKSFASGERTFLSDFSGNGEPDPEWGTIVNPLLGNWETEQPGRDEAAAVEVNAAYAAQVVTRYGLRPTPLHRYTQAKCLKWCQNSPLIAALMAVVGRPSGYMLTGKEAVLLRRRAVDGLITPGMVDRLFSMRVSSPLRGEVGRFASATLTGKKLRELDLMSRRHQGGMMQALAGYTRFIEGDQIRGWWHSFLAELQGSRIDTFGQMEGVNV